MTDKYKKRLLKMHQEYAVKKIKEHEKQLKAWENFLKDISKKYQIINKPSKEGNND